MPVKRPPALIPLESLTGADFAAHRQFSRIVDDKGRYLPFDEFRHRVSRRHNLDLAWTMTRIARHAAMQWIDYYDEAGQQAGFIITPAMAEVCEHVDKQATRLALKELTQRLKGAGAELNQLELDEPITSSQLEGANTTTLVARQMLETGREPRTADEQMIAGNARLMAEIPHWIGEPLTPALIRRFHATGMAGIDDDKYLPGEFRTTDDIVIADYDGNVVHQPPAAGQLPERLEALCDWVNDSTVYIHPLIKACILHFMIAHEHPFRDGNGRTSRALFYWFMLKAGYDTFKYISISSLLHAAPVKYALSYQYTETDGMDLTYFLEYQTRIVARALDVLLQHVDNLTLRAAALDRRLFQSGALTRLSPRQVTLLNVMLSTEGKAYTAADVSEALGISDNTARNDLRAIVREGFADEIAVNAQKTVYLSRRNLV
ncbi:Fic family protein [Erwiniaceae bacterium CAU 1747]